MSLFKVVGRDASERRTRVERGQPVVCLKERLVLFYPPVKWSPCWRPTAANLFDREAAYAFSK
jgi:hypothetical protein